MKKYNFVYITTNIIDGKQYIGDHSCDNLNDNYKGSGIYLKRAFSKYGKQNFVRKILEFYDSKEAAFNMQQKYIQQYKTLYPNGYNISPKGGHQAKDSISENTKLKMQLCKIGKKRKPFSEEHKQNIGKASKITNSGRKHTEEQNKFHNAQLKGRKLSEETKLKMRKPHKKFSEEYKQTLKGRRKGIPVLEKTKEKIRQTLKNKKINHLQFLVSG